MKIQREEEAADDSSWSSHEERGTGFWMRAALWGIQRLNPRSLRLLLSPIAFYYFLWAGLARRASQDYLSQVASVSGRRAPRLRDSYAHIHTFAKVILDRFVLWSGRGDTFDVTYHGLDRMQALVDEGQGAMLIGAHLGNFDILRLVAREARIPVNVLMYLENAQRINDAFKSLDPDSIVRIIHVDPDSPGIGFEVRECIKRGEFVAVLSDRVGANRRKRMSRFQFLGREAYFPQGPFLLASLMQVPVILTVALKRGSRQYEIFMEEISDGKVEEGLERKAVISRQMALFVSRLEHYCLDSPYQWFNFFDFWSGDDSV